MYPRPKGVPALLETRPTLPIGCAHRGGHPSALYGFAAKPRRFVSSPVRVTIADAGELRGFAPRADKGAVPEAPPLRSVRPPRSFLVLATPILAEGHRLHAQPAF